MLKRSLACLIIATMLLAGCVNLPPFTTVIGSGKPVTQTFDFSDFDSLVVSSAFQAEVVSADAYSVEVTVDDNLVERLQVEQRGQTVYIGLGPNIGLTNGTLSARVSMPDLVSLEASGASRVTFTGFKSGHDLGLNVSGASNAKGSVESGDVTIDVSGASRLVLSGSGGSLRANVSGASTADLSDFGVADANVEASGASRINVNASGRLDAEASGASSVRYSGNPTMGRINESGAGTVAPQ